MGLICNNYFKPFSISNNASLNELRVHTFDICWSYLGSDHSQEAIEWQNQ